MTPHQTSKYVKLNRDKGAMQQQLSNAKRNSEKANRNKVETGEVEIKGITGVLVGGDWVPMKEHGGGGGGGRGML